MQKVVFTSLPGTCFKYSKHVRRQLAQGIHNQGAVETETSVQKSTGFMFQYSKHARRQLAQGIHNPGAVETETSGRLTRRTWRPGRLTHRTWRPKGYWPRRT